MKKRNKIIVISVLILVIALTILTFVGYGIYRMFYDIQHIKGQDVINQSTSPDGKYTITAYLDNGGATVDYAVLCQVKNNKTNKTKNIYWQYHCEDAKIEWLNDNTVNINGITLNVTKDIYDWRR